MPVFCRLTAEEFPVDLLPSVVEPGTVIGHTATVWHRIPKGTPVLVAMGDLQCSTLSALPGSQDAGVLNCIAIICDDYTIYICIYHMGY